MFVHAITPTFKGKHAFLVLGKPATCVSKQNHSFHPSPKLCLLKQPFENSILSKVLIHLESSSLTLQLQSRGYLHNLQFLVWITKVDLINLNSERHTLLLAWKCELYQFRPRDKSISNRLKTYLCLPKSLLFAICDNGANMENQNHKLP